MDPDNCDRVLIIKKSGDTTHFSRSRKVTNPNNDIGSWDRYSPKDDIVSTTEWGGNWRCTHGDWYAKIVGNTLHILWTGDSFTFEEAFYYQYSHYKEMTKHLGKDVDHLEYYRKGVKKRRYLVI